MNIFTVNQVNHPYVVERVRTSTAQPETAGDIKVLSDDGHLYFKYFGKGGLVRSDLIDVKNIISYKTTVASKMARNLKVATITVSTNAQDATTSTNVVAGQDYVLRLEFDGYVGISPEDSKYWKHAAVHSTNGMSKSDFYKRMAISLAKNMAREAVQLVKVYIGSGSNNATQTEVTKYTKFEDLSDIATATALIVKEVEPDWILGTKQQKPLRFKAVPTEITVQEGNFYNEVCWGEVVYSNGDTVKNGKLTADYEYFYMGERGDKYRMVGFPDYVPTSYMVDPTKEYDYITIHYAYVGSNESVQKSEKDITFVAPRAAADTTATNLGTIAAALDTAIQAELSKYQAYTKAETDAAAAEGGD